MTVALMSTRALIVLCLFGAAALSPLAVSQSKRTWVDPPASLDSLTVTAGRSATDGPWPDEASRRLLPKMQVARIDATGSIAPPQHLLVRGTEEAKPVQNSNGAATASQPRPAERVATRREKFSEQRRRVAAVREEPETASTPPTETRIAEADQARTRSAVGADTRAAPIISDPVFRGD